MWTPELAMLKRSLERLKELIKTAELNATQYNLTREVINEIQDYLEKQGHGGT